ncbi:MAG: cob(I)yrinic acid a,c-diamide adenosyltransferase [candidate division Zixibacteria bacterium]|nr:cob(I)yrinic acid a,c-diamide adenosyltransferase [candidate division Zixibacteria bacterium]
MNKKQKRYIQIYTGNGKGKTTAALGQALRAAGHGLKTFIIMFMKDHPYGELKALEILKDFITVERFGNDAFVFRKQPPDETDLAAARKGLERAKEVIFSGEYDIVILDEICVATYFKLVKPEDVLPLLKEKPDGVELILTGRYCPEEWLEPADLVTEMREIRHYYQKGIIAREGFES